MTGSRGAALVGTGTAVPQHRLTNAQLLEMVETSDAWIVKHTGIRERRIAGRTDTTSTLAERAARQALADARLTVDDLELIVVATVTPDMPSPSTACLIHGRLKPARPIPAFDINAGCAGRMRR